MRRWTVVMLLTVLGGWAAGCGRAVPTASGATETRRYAVEGMTCEGCVKGISGTVLGLPGVVSVEVTLEDKAMTVSADPARVDWPRLQAKVAAMGYTVSLEAEAPDPALPEGPEPLAEEGQ